MSNEKYSIPFCIVTITSSCDFWVRTQQPQALVQCPRFHSCRLFPGSFSQHPQPRPQHPPRLTQSARRYLLKYQSGSLRRCRNVTLKGPEGMSPSSAPFNRVYFQYKLLSCSSSFSHSWSSGEDYSLSSDSMSDLDKAWASSCK